MGWLVDEKERWIAFSLLPGCVRGSYFSDLKSLRLILSVRRGS